MKDTKRHVKDFLKKRGSPFTSIITVLAGFLIFGIIIHGAFLGTQTTIKISRISMIPWQQNVVYSTDAELTIVVWDNYDSRIVNVDVTISGCNITEQTERTQHWGATYPPFSLARISLPSGILNGTIRVVTEKEGFEKMTFELIVVIR